MQTVSHTTQTVNMPLPEAACSVNGYFYLDGNPERYQATGRGWTPAEAAANLKETIDATRAALVLPAPLTMEQQVAQLLACGLKKATCPMDLTLVERLAKAAALVLGGKVAPGNREGVFAVWSMSNPDHYYEVEGNACSCKDSEHHPERACKHRCAVAMFQRLDA